MPRPTDSDLLSILENAQVASTVNLALRDGATFEFCSGIRNLSLDEGDYTPQILRVSDLKETLGVPTNRVSVVLGNVNLEWGLTASFPLRRLDGADATVRLYMQEDTAASPIVKHLHYFYGKIVTATADEREVSFDIVSDTTYAGTRFAVETLTPNKGWIFPGGVRQSPPGGGNNDGGIGGGIRVDPLDFQSQQY